MAFFFVRAAHDRDKAYRKGDWDAVIRYGEEELKEQPQNIKVLNDLAYAYYRKGNRQRALELCEAIYRWHPHTDLLAQSQHLGPRYMRHHEVLADCYYHLGRDEEALAICARLRPLDPLFSKKYSIAAKIYQRRGELESAAKQYAAMATKCPRHFNEAMKALLDLVMQDALDNGPFRVLHELLLELGQLPGFISSYEHLCRTGKAGEKPLYVLVHLYHFDQAYDKEIELIHRHMADMPRNALLHVFLARAHAAKGEYPQAETCLNAAMEMDAQHAERYRRMLRELRQGEQEAEQELLMRATELLGEHCFAEAASCYDKLLVIHPDHTAYRKGLVQALSGAIAEAIQAGEAEQAMALMHRLAATAPEQEEVKRQLHAYEEQLAELRRVQLEGKLQHEELAQDQRLRLQAELAELYRRQKRADKAVGLWQELAGQGGAVAEEALYRLASYYLQAQDGEKAEPWVQRFAQLPCTGEKRMQHMYELGLACVRLGLRQRGRDLFTKLHAADAAYRDVAQQLEELNRAAPTQEVAEAVMVVDLCESSRMMDLYGDEVTNRVKNDLEGIMFPIFEAAQSRFKKSTGDGFLVCFPSLRQAVDAAIGILRQLAVYNTQHAGGPEVHLRFAVHFGPVRIRPDGDRHGTHVNIPFRVEGLKPEALIEVEGGMRRDEMPRQDRILITEAAYEQLQRHGSYRCRYVGLFELRNITGVHKIYQVLPPQAGNTA